MANMPPRGELRAIPIQLIDTPAKLSTVLDIMKYHEDPSLKLHLDIEGHDAISILTIYIPPQMSIYLIDVTTLRASAFSITGRTGLTLKLVLETRRFTKVLFDVRKDSEALFSQYGIKLLGVADLQLMELATRKGSKKWLKSLAKCVEQDGQVEEPLRAAWKEIKDEGRKLYDPKLAGDSAAFDQRPLPAILYKYCGGDVVFMPQLYDVYYAKITHAWAAKIREATRDRVAESQDPGSKEIDRHPGQGPRGW